MAMKFAVMCCLVAAANAGLLAAPAPLAYGYPGYPSSYPQAPVSVTSQQQNILRSYGNLGQVSSYSKTIDTPFSSVSKADVRVSNPGLAIASPYGAYGASPLAYGHGAPLAYGHAAPLAYGASPLAYGASPLAYGGVAKIASPLAYAAPAYGGIAKVAAPAVVTGHGLLGVAYSAAPAVSHMTYSNGLGLAYSW